MTQKIIYSTILLIGLFFFIDDGAYILDDSHGLNYPAEEGTMTDKLGVYVVNLDRSPERLAYVMPYIEKLSFPVTRISAIDGRLLSPEDLRKNLDTVRHLKYVGKEMNVGMAGCSLSHMKVWETFLASSNEYALVFEDDVSFDPVRLQCVVNDVIDVPELWDLVNFENYHRSLNFSIKKLSHGLDLVVFLTPVTHAGCYLLNRHAARQLLAKSYPLIVPVDYYFSRTWELDIKFAGVVPNLVAQSMGTSEIAKTKNVEEGERSFDNRVRVKITRAVYRVKSDVMRFVSSVRQYVNAKLMQA